MPRQAQQTSRDLAFQGAEVRQGEREDFDACKAFQIQLISRFRLQSEPPSLAPAMPHPPQAAEPRRDLHGRPGNVARLRRVRASAPLFAWQTALRKESGRRPTIAML